MSATQTVPGGRFYRNADKAILGGVCAGIADYLGFNLRVTRILAFICFLMVMPIALLVYFGVVFLTPSVSAGNVKGTGRRSGRKRRKKRKESAPDGVDEPARSELAIVIDERCREMDRRLALLEEHVTSKRFQLEQDLRNL